MSSVDLRLVVLAGVWSVWAVGAEVVSIRAGVVENHVLDLSVGAAYLAGGLVALRRRRASRLGLLMVAVAFLWFIGNYGNVGLPGLAAVGAGFGGVSLPLVVWLFFAYPSGRMQTAAERAYIAGFGVWELANGVVVAAASDSRAVQWMDGVGVVLDVMLPIGGGILLGLKYRRASVVERRALVPLWIGGALLVTAFLIDGFVGGDPVRDRAAYTLFQLESVARLGVPVCFLWALLRSNLDRGGIGDLVERLSQPIPAGGLRDAMAEVLHDPHLRLLFPLGEGWVDEAGRPLAEPEGAGSGVTRIERDGHTLAVVQHDPAIDRAVIAAAGAATAMALDNARLHAELRAHLEEVRASRARIVTATDLERRRIERDLHDGAQQRLLALSFRLRAAQRHGTGDPALMADLGEAEAELRGAIEELRNLARGIHPVILTDEGLLPALEALADRAPLPVTITTTLSSRLPAAVEGAAYFVVAESLTNAARYAASPVVVRVEVHAGCLFVSVSDDGPGGADSSRGSGLRGLADRVEAVDGRLTVASPPGAGTTVTAEVPCA